jgi:dTDP-glucose pyrophosphorylase
MHEISQFCVSPDESIAAVMRCLDQNAKQIALLVDGDRHLLGTVTDGDIRRRILAGLTIDAPATELTRDRTRAPVVAHIDTPHDVLFAMMRENSVRQIPLLDDDQRVVDIALSTEFDNVDSDFRMKAVVMAGGQGIRLRPLTENTPKPMLPVGGKPLLERIINRLRQSGVTNVHLTTHYLAERIHDYFGNGEAFGVNLSYVNEEHPLGTAGALSLLEDSEDPVLVMNGDILTRIDFRSMLVFHNENRAALTVAVREEKFTIPFGVVETSGVRITKIVEKPSIARFVSAGIYLLSPHARRRVPKDQKFDMPTLISNLIDAGERVISFPLHEYWLDIGRHEDFAKANQDAAVGAFG